MTLSNGEGIPVEMKTAKKYGKRYPWTTWFRRGRFTLTRGIEFSCLTHGMAAMVRNVASRKRLRISIQQDGTTIQVTVLGNKD